ncbi:hypothetical protein PR048_008964 [Dryococelus australis]|uniref:Uncharacterized protein n=1 Tax=Dryococelus australis TaxID=614101 RepID=A0ABQ9HZM6_9NEOP|nr:hypothetical protein PR048_008964 [Dryococelus australis]
MESLEFFWHHLRDGALHCLNKAVLANYGSSTCNSIRAERLGDWDLHLQCVQSILPYLHTAGPFHYAKSAVLYVQQMEELPSLTPSHEFNIFTSEGFFTLWRKNNLWREGGPFPHALCNNLEKLSGIKTGSSQQHVQLRDCHRTSVAHDVVVLLS